MNTFRPSLVEHSEIDGDFDIVFRYTSIAWETGDASGGMDGLGGTSAHVGFTTAAARLGPPSSSAARACPAPS